MHAKNSSLTITKAILLLAASLFSCFASAQSRPINAIIDASKTGAPISRYLYGQFLEHIGGIVNNGIWAEMLDDRKFYFPITSHPPAEPIGQPGFRRVPPRHWMPIGADEFVIMDNDKPYTGDHSPLVKLEKSEPHGFVQTGIAVREEKAYTGRIVLSGSPTAAVNVTLIWGNQAVDRQTITVSALGSDYRKFPLRFVAKSNSDDARIEITGTGAGFFKVGAVSLMPADNMGGFRREVVEELKQLHSGVYRFPGGNFVSAYEWRNAVGDIDERPPIYDPVWHAVQPNDVGTDEFLALCRLLDVEPYITVNAGFGDAWSARELVEYTNGAVSSLMGKWRAANGHPKPYNVKFWGIGNEPWGDYQMGAMATEQFELKHVLFAKAMRKVDPSIILIAGGAMPDVMAGANQSKRISGKFVPDYLSTADWSGYLLAHCLDYIDMLSEHFYSSSNMHTDLKLEKKVDIGPQSLIEWERAPATQVRVKFEHYQEYLKLIPALKAKPVPIAIDEWAYMDRESPPSSYKTVPAYAWAFHEMFRHSDLFQLGAFTFATAMISEDRTRAVLSPTGLLFKMYREHFGTTPVEVTGDSPQPKPTFPAGGDQPAVNPGSETYPLDVSAALSDDRKTLTFAVLNPSDSEQNLKVAIEGAKLANQGHLWRMAPVTVTATNTVGQKPEVEVRAQQLASVPDEVSVPPFSVSIYSFLMQ
ncbi:MAG TPA: alpha-L-arabinofuranosidase C-terminal domain-containing protein [Dongiaceae bacterium]|nr:alpha-L-arabinofuranosidase C-terminal domain-containing protein [Dongiaceae bacterium]